jgi:hypothetical protein
MKQRMSSRTTAFMVLLLAVSLTNFCAWGEEMDPTRNQAPASAEEICPILAGATLPALNYRTVDGSPFELNAAVREKPTVLIYYRGGW